MSSFHSRQHGFQYSIVCLAALFSFTLFATAARAQTERPPTEQLLPETTVGYIKIANIREMVEKVGRSNMGKLLADENIAPLAQGIYEQGVEAYEEYVKIGLTLDEIKSLPAGEMTIAVIAPKRKKPVFLFLVQTDPENEAVAKALGSDATLRKSKAPNWKQKNLTK